MFADKVGPDVERDQAQTAEGVIDDAAGQDGFTHFKQRVAIEHDDLVEDLRREGERGGVEDVGTQEEKDADAGEFVQPTGRLGMTTFIERGELEHTIDCK